MCSGRASAARPRAAAAHPRQGPSQNHPMSHGHSRRAPVCLSRSRHESAGREPYPYSIVPDHVVRLFCPCMLGCRSNRKRGQPTELSGPESLTNVIPAWQAPETRRPSTATPCCGIPDCRQCSKAGRPRPLPELAYRPTRYAAREVRVQTGKLPRSNSPSESAGEYSRAGCRRCLRSRGPRASASGGCRRIWRLKQHVTSLLAWRGMQERSELRRPRSQVHPLGDSQRCKNTTDPITEPPRTTL